MKFNILALLGAASAQVEGCIEIVGNYCVLDRGTPTMDGYKLVTVAQAKADSATIGPMLGYWSIVALADGKMDGEAYNYKVSRGICGKECGQKLVIHTGSVAQAPLKDDPTPATFEIVNPGMPPASGFRTCTYAQAKTYQNQIADMIGSWSYVALADGSINGDGWSGHIEIKKGICGPICGEKLLIQLAPQEVEQTESLTLSSLKEEAPVAVEETEDLGIGPADIENLLAGLIEGLVGNNDLPEIKKCLNDSSTIEKQLLLAIGFFEKGDISDIIKGIQVIGGILQNLNSTLGDCEGMQDDIKRIETWASIFEDPQKLVQTLVQNTIMHLTEVEADLAKVQSDFLNGDFMSVGMDIAAVLILELGKVPAALVAFFQ